MNYLNYNVLICACQDLTFMKFSKWVATNNNKDYLLIFSLKKFSKGEVNAV